MTARVVLVRGPRSAGAGGGCCSGDVRPFDEGGGHRHDRPADEMGQLWLSLRERLPDDVDLQLVSPSNWLWLVPALVADGRRRGLRGGALLRQVRGGTAVSSVVVDGEVVLSGTLPSLDQAVTAVEAALALR